MTHPLATAEGTLEHVQWLRRLARSLVLDASAADDLSQETWVAALAEPPPDDRPLRGWLAGVLQNRVRMRARGERRRRAREHQAARAEALPSTLDLLLRLSLQKELVAHVEALDEPYRTTILLRYFEGLRPAVIAERQGVPVATVKTRLQRALERLRARLDARHGGERRTWAVALAALAGDPLGPGKPLSFVAPLAPAAAATGALVMSAKIPVALLIMVSAAAGLWWLEGGGGAVGPEPAAGAPAPTLAAAEPAPAPEIETLRPQPARSAVVPAAAPVSLEEDPPPPAAASGVRGRVIDVESLPVAGIPVRLLTRADEELGRTLSAADGGFSLESTSERTGSARLVAADERRTTVLAAFVHEPAVGDLTVVVAPRAPLAGIVVDATGRPVPEAQVSYRLPWDLRSRFDVILDRSSEETWFTTSDPAGAFELPDAPQVAGAVLAAERQGLGESVVQVEGSDLALRIVLGRPRYHAATQIHGRVLDPFGEPVPGAHVALGYADNRTDAQGRFTIDVRHGEQQTSAATLRAVHPGFLPAELTKDRERGWPETCELRFPGVSLTITGRVVTQDGEPLAGAEVRIVDKTEFGAVRDRPEDNFSRQGFVEDLAAGTDDVVATDAHGRFTLSGLLPRDYTVDAFDPRALVSARVEHVAAGVTGLEIRLAGVARGPVRGRVMGLDGAPLPGLQIRPYLRPEDRASEAALFPRDLRYGASVTSDAQGAFHFDSVPTAGLGLSIYGGEIVIMTHWPVPEGADRAALEVRLARHGRFRVELVSQPELGDRFEILDAADQRLPVAQGMGGGMSFSSDYTSLSAGRTAVLSVAETARTLVLFSREGEVLRVPVKVTPGAVSVIEL